MTAEGTADGAAGGEGTATGAPEGAASEPTGGGLPSSGRDGALGGGEGGQVDPNFTIPEAYREKSWADNIKSVDDLYKQFDNQQEMIGKKFEPPSADASEEDLNAFYDKLRPEKAESYDLSLPEGVDLQLSEEQVGVYKNLFHKHGLTPEQAKGVYADYIQSEIAAQPTSEALDKEFDTMMADKFGDKVNDALKVSARFMGGLSEEEKAGLRSLPNEQFISVISMLQKAGAASGEDGMPDGGDPAGSASKSIDEVRKDLAALRSDPATRDPTHADYQKNNEEVKRLSEIVGKHYK